MVSPSLFALDRPLRSKLFVPGSRPQLFEKAVAGEADILSFDLEDAVVPDKKVEARGSVTSFLRSDADKRNKVIIVRVNELGSEWFRDDVETLLGPGVDIINLPKVESGEQIRAAVEEMERVEKAKGLKTQTSLLANIETPKGLRLAFEIASASPRVMGLQLGFIDFSLSCGIDSREQMALNAMRLGMRFAAAEADIVTFDGAFPEVKNSEGFRADAENARRLGFIGKSCIHPSQVPIANEVFSPDAEEVARAEAILAASEQKTLEGVGAFLHDGKMIDVPVIARARAIIASAASQRGASAK